jgi:hypothetical protein
MFIRRVFKLVVGDLRPFPVSGQHVGIENFREIKTPAGLPRLSATQSSTFLCSRRGIDLHVKTFLIFRLPPEVQGTHYSPLGSIIIQSNTLTLFKDL